MKMLAVQYIPLLIVALCKYALSNLIHDPEFQGYTLNQTTTDQFGTTVMRAIKQNDPQKIYNKAQSNYQIKQFNLPNGQRTKVYDMKNSVWATYCQIINPSIGQEYNIIFNVYMQSITKQAEIGIEFNSSKYRSYELKKGDVGDVVQINTLVNFSYTPVEFCVIIEDQRYEHFVSTANKLKLLINLDNINIIIPGEEYYVYGKERPINAPTSNQSDIHSNTTANMTSNDSNTTGNTTSDQSSNSTTTNQTSSNITKDPLQMVISMRMNQDFFSDKVYFTSNLSLTLFQLQPNQLKSLQVFIEGEYQIWTNPNKDKANFFVLQMIPQRIYDYLKCKVQIYFPGTLKIYLQQYKLRIILEGRELVYSSLTSPEARVLSFMEKYMIQMAEWTRKGYLAINGVYCSYFIFNLVSFWNLSLLYTFLQVKTLPLYIYNIMEQMSNILFTKNTLILYITRILTGQPRQIDPQALSQTQKMNSYENGFAWFAQMGMSCKFISNNLEPLILLAFLCAKYAIIKKAFSCTRIKNGPFGNLNFIQFYHQFNSELICFSPFMILSTMQVLRDMGQPNLKGKIDIFLHICLLILVLGLPISQLCLNMIEIDKERKKYYKKKRKINSKNIEFNKIENNERISFYILYAMIPALVIMRNHWSFFSVVTLILIWRLGHFFKNIKFYSRYQKFIRGSNNVIWIIFHFSFLLLFTIQKVLQNYQKSKLNCSLIENICKYAGIIIIICILIGGLINILDFIVSLFQFFIQIVRKICSQKKITSKKQDKAKKLQKQSNNEQYQQENQIKIEKPEPKVKNQPYIDISSMKSYFSDDQKTPEEGIKIRFIFLPVEVVKKKQSPSNKYHK